MSNYPKHGSKHGPGYGPTRGPRNPYDQSERSRNPNVDEFGQSPRFTRPETGYGEDLRDFGQDDRRYGGDAYQESNQDIRGAGFNSQPSPYDRGEYRYERDEYLQARGGLPGFKPSARSGSGYIYNGMSGRDQTGVDHTGRGPKGWKRSDERICDDVSEILERHPGIDASEIEVSVKEGIVTLAGSVDHRRSKRLVEDAIDHVSGIKDIRNELNVNQSLFNQAREILTGENVPADRQTKSKH